VGSSPTPRTYPEPAKFEDFSEWLRNKGNSQTTIDCKIKILKRLDKRLNLWDIEAFDRLIINSPWSNGFKNNAINAYADWCVSKGFECKRRKYKKEEKLPYIPSEKDLDDLIAGSGPKLAVFLQLLKESGFRPIEVTRLCPEDFDLEKQVCYLNQPAKGSLPRVFKMSSRLTKMSSVIIAKTKPKNPLWSGALEHIRRNYELQRREISVKLQNPNLLKISFRTFRHWKATMEYSRTKDILYVKQLLSHRRIENTLVYTHLLAFEKEDNYVVKVASTIEEFTSLLESGFEYVSDYEGKKILKKRK
jgi:integrase